MVSQKKQIWQQGNRMTGNRNTGNQISWNCFLVCFLASKKFSFIGQWEVLQQVKSLYTSRFVLLFKNSLMFLYGSEVNLHGAIFYNALQKRW